MPTTAPVASFTANGSTASSITVTQGQTVNLVDTSTGTVASRSWNLGDGTTATTATVVKSYSTTGTKTVALSVTGAGVTKSASKTINVTAAAPVANFSATPLSGTAPLTVQFTDASTGSITSRSWSFGNGATSTSQNPSYTYSSPGTYTVALTVTGSGGSNTATKTGYITVGSTTGGGSASLSGLVAAYGFEEASGSQALDASGNGNHGTLAYVTRSASGKFGKALSFDGANSRVTVEDSSSLQLTTGLTLAAWIKPDRLSDRQPIITKQGTSVSGAQRGFMFSAGDSSGGATLYFEAFASDIGAKGTSLTSSTALKTGVWQHVAATYKYVANGTYVITLYVDGQEAAKTNTAVGPLQANPQPLEIGRYNWSSSYQVYFKGLTDEVRVFNRALNQSEITAIAQVPVTQSPLPGSICASPCSLWDDATVPTVAATSETAAQELGVRFRSDVAGKVTGVRFYKGSGNTGTHLGRLWSSSGQLLAQATFSNESASGWQQVNFASPVAIQAGTTYVVSYYAPAGRHAYDRDYLLTGYTKGPLRALADGEAGGNGLYCYGSGGCFPSSSYSSTNYWVDVVFQTP